MITGPYGLAMIKRFEGCRLEAYQDSRGICTVGWGHTRSARPGMEITSEQAEELFVADIAVAEADVARLITVPLTSSMHDALVSWTFNLGGENLAVSTMRQRLNDRRYLDAGHEMTRWWRTPGSELGQQRRRAAEWALFLEDGLP